MTAASVRRVQSELRIRGDRHTLDWLDRLSERDLDVRCALDHPRMFLAMVAGSCREKLQFLIKSN